MKKPRRKQIRADLVTPFRDKLWELFLSLSKGLDGADVVAALRQSSYEVWNAGIDRKYSQMNDLNDLPLANAFDITWLTVVCVRLKAMRAKRRPRRK